MRKKTVSGILLSLLLIGMLTLAFNIKPFEASPDGLTPHDPILIEDNSEFTLENGVTGGSGTTEDPYIIENWDIDASTVLPSPSFPYGGGIQIRNTDAHFIIRNVWVHDGYWDTHVVDGIFLDHVVNGRIENTRTSNNEYGIFLWYSSYIDVVNCSTLNDRSGSIRLSYSSYNNLYGNNLTQINFGIDLWAYSHYNRIVGNEILNNNVGVMIFRSNHNVVANNTILGRKSPPPGPGHMGVEIWESRNNEISDNVVSNNERGIFFFTQAPGESYDNVITRNVFRCNVYGIHIKYEVPQLHDNLIYHNNFVNNTSQVYAEGSNVWDDGYPSGGNFWSDYTGVDVKSGPYQNKKGSDGIGDTPYTIDADNQDNYPLMSPWGDVEPPVADAGLDLTVVLGKTVILDGSKSIDDVGVKTYVWTFTDITPQTLTGMQPTYTFNNVGDFEVTLNVSDYADNWDTDTVTITVVAGYALIIHSSPSGVTFTVDDISYTTPWSGPYSEGAWVSLVMPETHRVVDAIYCWDQWSDGNTSRSRTVTINTNITLTAYYTGPYYVTWSNDATNYRLNYLDCIFKQMGLPHAAIPTAIEFTAKGAEGLAALTDGVVDVQDIKQFMAEYMVEIGAVPTLDAAYEAIAECEAACRLMFSDFPVTLEEETYHITTVCNSTISAFEFDQVNRIIMFNVAGEEGIGFCRVCIPHDLMEPPYTVTVDGHSPQYVNYTLYDNGTHRWIYFTYIHSEHKVEIVPEFPSFLILPLFMLATLLAVIVYRRKHPM